MQPGGRVVCLEITLPQTPVFGDLFRAYFFGVVPLIGAPSADMARPTATCRICVGVPASAGVAADHGIGRAARRVLPACHAGHGGDSLGDEMKRIVIGMSGASGQIYGIRLLEVLRAAPRGGDPSGDDARLRASPSPKRPTRPARCRGAGDVGYARLTSARPSPAVRSRRPAWSSCRAASSLCRPSRIVHR